MWSIILGWPYLVQLAALFGLFLVTAFVIITVAKCGNMAIKWGWLNIGLGSKKGRSCSDCASMLVGKTTKYFTNIYLKKNVLDEQMTFASHKLDRVHLNFIKAYRASITKARDPKDDDPERENVQYGLLQEASKNGMDLVKCEIRRSFKENGFVEMSGKEFSMYVKNETNILLDTLTSYLMQSYPNHGMMVSLDDALENLNKDRIEDIIFDIYTNAKYLKKESIQYVENEKTKFYEDIDKFIETKQ